MHPYNFIEKPTHTSELTLAPATRDRAIEDLLARIRVAILEAIQKEVSEPRPRN